jgi:hypothetical protein
VLVVGALRWVTHSTAVTVTAETTTKGKRCSGHCIPPGLPSGNLRHLVTLHMWMQPLPMPCTQTNTCYKK